MFRTNNYQPQGNNIKFLINCIAQFSNQLSINNFQINFNKTKQLEYLKILSFGFMLKLLEI